MADLSLDEIISKNQGVNMKEKPLNQNVRKPFQGKPVQQRIQLNPFKPGFTTKGNHPGGAPLKRAFSAPGPKPKNGSPMKLRGAQTPNSGAGRGTPGKGQIDARDMISIKNRIKISDARLKILQKRMNKGNIGPQSQQHQIPPPAMPGPQGLGPGNQQRFPPPQQTGFQPPQQPPRPPGPQRFNQPNQRFQQPRPQLEQQGPRPNQQRPPHPGQQQAPPFNQQRPRFTSQQRPPFPQQQRPLFNQQQRPPFNQQQRPPFNQQQRPPFNQQQRPPFNQQQRPPFNQQQRPPFNQQGPLFDQQQPPFSQPSPQFNQQPPEFIQQQQEFEQQPQDFIQEPFDQMPPQFGQDQAPPFPPEEPLQFIPDEQFDQQPGPFGPHGPLDQPEQFGQQGAPNQQFNQPDSQFGQPPPQMNQPPPNFMQPAPGPGQPGPFNQPPGNQGFNQPPPQLMEPPADMSQPPPGFGQMPPGFSEPPPGFQMVPEEEEGDFMGFVPTNPVENTRVEDTGTSLRITRTIPEVSFDGENLTVTRRMPAGSNNQQTQKPFSDIWPGANKFTVSKPAPQPPKKKFQPIPIKAPSPPKTVVKTGGPTLNKNRTTASSVGQPPARACPPIQTPAANPVQQKPVLSSSVNSVTNTRIRTAKTETAPPPAIFTRTLNNVPQQPPRSNPPSLAPGSLSAPERPSALSRIKMPNQSAESVFSRIQQPPQNIRTALSRGPQLNQAPQGASILSRLSSPGIPVTKRLAPPSATPSQPARVPQVPAGARVAVKRPALSLSERFSSGDSGNPIPVITDLGPVKKRRSTEPESDFGSDFATEGQYSNQEEHGVPLLSPLQGYRILVSNLHSSVTQDDVIELFGALGPLKRANMLTKGQAEVAFIHKEHALSALKTYHNRELDGQPMFVKLTTPLNAKVMQPPGEDSPTVSLPATLRAKKAPPPSSAPVEIPLIHKALFKTSTDSTAPTKAVRFTVKL